MVPTLTAALRQIREDIAAALSPDTLRSLCEQVGHTWRERILDPVTTIHLFVLQILHRNTAAAHLPRLTGRTFSPSAYCQARARLPLAVPRELVSRVADAVRPLTGGDGERWRGLRTFFVDGSGVSMPDTPALQAAFGQPTNRAPGCGFPVGRVLALFHAGTGLLLKFLTAPLRSHEASQVADTHDALQAGMCWSGIARSARSPTWPSSSAVGFTGCSATTRTGSSTSGRAARTPSPVPTWATPADRGRVG